ncbi:hypothetical protein CDAR_171101 [Caerostris darwini]|uniref:Uncharacterized protein n=1 Tax=Caerostris darwini TaxID=1538125 RepID=A0AAV4WLH3_9ARAC|nr:hypothetical protein CDAR_171101 [Caerostris darwini]
MVAAAGYYSGKTSDEEIYTVHETAKRKDVGKWDGGFYVGKQKGNCSLCWRFLSCALMMLMAWHGGSRELLIWKILEEVQIQCMNSSKVDKH